MSSSRMPLEIPYLIPLIYKRRTFFVAGCEQHQIFYPCVMLTVKCLDETSANTLSFALYELARAPTVQQKLHAEVSEVLRSGSASETFEYSLFEKMPYLLAVAKEVFRLHSVVTHGTFQAGKDNVIPFSKPVTTTTGETIESLQVRKGQRVVCHCVPESLIA